MQRERLLKNWFPIPFCCYVVLISRDPTYLAIMFVGRSLSELLCLSGSYIFGFCTKKMVCFGEMGRRSHTAKPLQPTVSTYGVVLGIKLADSGFEGTKFAAEPSLGFRRFLNTSDKWFLIICDTDSGSLSSCYLFPTILNCHYSL